jgi:hypothetical protein
MVLLRPKYSLTRSIMVRRMFIPLSNAKHGQVMHLIQPLGYAGFKV